MMLKLQLMQGLLVLAYQGGRPQSLLFEVLRYT